MAPVADTRTSIDANLERRLLREGNALLVQERDTLIRETNLWETALARVREAIGAHMGAGKTVKDFANLMAISLHEQRGQMQKDVDELAARKDVLSPEVMTLETRKASLAADLALHEEIARKARQDRDDAVKAASEARESTASQLNVHQNTLVDAEVKVEQAKKELEATKNENAAMRAKWVAEETRLATKDRDLAIYEDRVRQAGAKVGVNVIL